ncbi:MAG: SDR family oxidoreductase [Nitrospirota bacterium]
MVTYLVTGGAGFIGSNIVARLLKEEGSKVKILDDFSTGKRENIANSLDRIEVIEGDIRNFETVKKALEGVNYCFHQAALPSVERSVKDPLATNEVNITGTLNILIAAKDFGVKRVIYASSSSVYGDTPVLPKREDMSPSPLSPYAVTKLTAEEYCRIFYSVYGLETVSLRYFNVFGTNQDPTSPYAAVIPKFIMTMSTGKELLIYGDGGQSRDFTYIDNVVEANIRATKSTEGLGETFNIACGQRVTINELAKNIAKILNIDIKLIHADPRAGDVRHSLADISKAQNCLGYEPQVGFAEGLRLTVEWYKNKM